MAKQYSFDRYHQEFLDHLTKLCLAAQDQGLILRGLGAVAVISHCPHHLRLLSRMERHLTDLDVVALSSQEDRIESFFNSFGYEILGGRGVTVGMWTDRRIFVDTEGKRPDVDVFLDRLNFCHPIDLRKRLTLDFPSISLADLVLEKLQIVEINPKDLKDLIVLLLEHDFSQDDQPERINLAYIADLLAKDWGFYYTVSLNLDKVAAMANKWELDKEQRRVVKGRVATLRERMEVQPKSLKWRVRARIGPRVQWYQEVGEGYRDVSMRQEEEEL